MVRQHVGYTTKGKSIHLYVKFLWLSLYHSPFPSFFLPKYLLNNPLWLSHVFFLLCFLCMLSSLFKIIFECSCSDNPSDCCLLQNIWTNFYQGIYTIHTSFVENLREREGTMGWTPKFYNNLIRWFDNFGDLSKFWLIVVCS